MKKLNCAVIGCGRIGCGFDDGTDQIIRTHAGSYFNNKKTNLFALCDVDQKKLDKYGKKYSVSNVYDTSSELFNSNEIDCVSICTPANSHLSLVEKALSSNIKAIFLEKPISNNLKNSQKIINLCKKNNVILAIDFQRRFDPFYHHIKKMITNENLGKIKMINILYGGGIANTGTHLFDILRYFFGDIKKIESMLSKNKSGNIKDPNFDMLIHFKTNLIAHAHALDYSNYVIFEMDIFGTHGRLRINLVNNNATFQSTKNSGTISGYKKLDQKPLNYKSSKKSPLSLAVENVVSCVENKKQPLCTGIDGYKSLESVIACKLSAEKNKPISLPIRDMNYKIYSK